jgi:two-component system chemotaxis sensor kinase CheA
MNALHEQFVIEARELIHQATDDLIAVEREGVSADRIDRVFRAFHTLKGSAGVVELPPMGLTLHAAEDLLAAITTGHLGLSPALIDQALACLDQVSGWVDHFESHGSLPARAGEDARAMVNKLRNLLSGPSGASPRSMTADVGDALPSWVRRLIGSSPMKMSSDLERPPEQLLAFSYEPHAGCFFDGDDPLDLTRRVPKLLAFYLEPREAWPPLADMDPYSSNVRLKGISAATQAELAAVFRLVPDQVSIVAIPSTALQGVPILRAESRDAMALVRAVLEEQKHVLGAAQDPGGHTGRIGRIGSAARVAANALRHAKQESWAERIDAGGAAAISQSDPAPLLSVIDEALAAFTDNVEGFSASAQENQGGVIGRSLRVDEAKIDALIDLAGELLVAKNGLAHLTKRVEAEIGQEIARTMRSEHDAIARLVSDLHAAILQLRMVPMAQVFRSFPRLVRDMSQRLNKDVTLVTQGESTESDKTIVDLLFEPLMHLVRNALDHGIETPEQRRAAGKPEGATVVLRASRTGDRFVVNVSDDGRGIDPAAVRRKAEERRLLPADELAALSDEQAIELIFVAGFSTAAEVSDISGRGVGMDVVHATIERIGGRVSLKSRLGAGTTVSLDLPTNIAMSRLMVVEAGGQVFGLPMEAVSETLRLTPDRITRIKNNDGFVLHDRVVPICSLAELMHLPPKKSSDTYVRLVVVAEAGGRIAAFEVDAIRDRLEVVLKPMQGLLANARGYVGTTLLGDGGVLLVLDLKEILP